MKELCIPFRDIKENEMAEVEIKVPQRELVWRYRIEAVNFSSQGENITVTDKIEHLCNEIKTHDPDWELIQIIDSDEKTGYIKLLYRYKI
jgi:hypothetical protein